MSKNKIIIISIIVALAIGVSYIYARQTDTKETTSDTQTQTDQTNQANNNDLNDPITEADDTPENNSPPQESVDTEHKQTANPTITQLNQTDSKVSIRVIIDNVKSGSCTVIFSQPGQAEIRQTAEVGLVTSYYTCKGFDVSKSKFPSKGEWQVYVLFESDQAAGRSETKTITLN